MTDFPSTVEQYNRNPPPKDILSEVGLNPNPIHPDDFMGARMDISKFFEIGDNMIIFFPEMLICSGDCIHNTLKLNRKKVEVDKACTPLLKLE